MVQFCLHVNDLFAEPPKPQSSGIDSLILIGTKAGYEKHFDWACNSILEKILSNSKGNSKPKSKKQKTEGSAAAQELLRTLLSGLNPSPDSGNATECYFPKSDGNGPPLRVVLGVLPSVVSRHNSPGQPYAVTSLLKKTIRFKDVTVVAPLCESKDHWFSVACAIARVGGPFLYNSKTSSSSSNGAIAKNKIDFQTDLSQSDKAVKVVFTESIDATTQQKFALLALGIQLSRRLVDEPPNELHTTAFMEQALGLIRGMEHVSSKVIQGEELDKQGYGGMYNVGKAGPHPPALVILSYEPPAAKGKKSTVMVGKGVVFDTGGTQIKTKAGMPGMKRDMGGAASVLASFLSLVMSGAVQNQPLHAILCLAENSVASHAMRPDDVISMHSGKSVEINNTDAEGRLVLSDGVSHAFQYLSPQVIIDMATLTGAQGVATGKYFGALYCNDEELEQIAVKAGKSSGDLCHPMPYAPEFFRPEYSSAVADMKNSVADRANAQVSCAGQFIANHMGSFLEDGGKWVHIDMAYCVFDKKDERATGYGVGLLYSIVQSIESNIMST
ncbi:unnamed protein product [Cylindrotheca closterium]|uniref:Cytosol aminopeptidase domain-containing protein n=1 Tax=Cylindrotheca closterium TaxID=2856 RepID=A0AAD2FNM1_9STRA|nr:unnamed protein product [Cylindrotheca closterium]